MSEFKPLEVVRGLKPADYFKYQMEHEHTKQFYETIYDIAKRHHYTKALENERA